MILSTLDQTPFLIQPHSKGDEHVIHKRSIDHVLQKHSCLFSEEYTLESVPKVQNMDNRLLISLTLTDEAQ